MIAASLLPLLFFLGTASCRASSPRVILLITIDTLRADHLGCHGYPRDTTPFLDQLAQKGTRFERAFTPMPITCAGHASILTSLHPLTHQLMTNGNDVLRDNVQTIAEVFAENGFHTIGTVGTTFLTSQFGFDQGFADYSDHIDNWTRDASKVNESFFAQINSWKNNADLHKKPLFVWIHYYDVHAPYLDHSHTFSQPIPQRFNLKAGKNKGLFARIEKYDQEIRFVDDAIRKVFAFLEANNLDGNLTACITADHGEQHMEHGFQHQHCDFYTETTHVPLILTGPGFPVSERVAYPVSSVDIAQTLVENASLRFAYKTDGHNLFTAPQKDREMLIAGHPYYHYSLQLLRYPQTYILNEDKHYSHWYFANERVFPETTLKPAPQALISTEKLKKEKLTFSFPDATQTEPLWAAASMRLRIPPNAEASVWFNFNQRLYNSRKLTTENSVITVVHPVTALSRYQIKLELYHDPGVQVSDLQYALLTTAELSPSLSRFTPQPNALFDNLTTLRKTRENDERYNLETDFPMFRDIWGESDGKTIDESRGKILKWFAHYRDKGRKLLGERVYSKKLGRRQIDMLKSLGYL